MRGLSVPGCGGVIFLLLERRQTASPLFSALERAFAERTAVAVAKAILDGPHIGHSRISSASLGSPAPEAVPHCKPSLAEDLERLGQICLEEHTSFERTLSIDGARMRVLADYRPARPGLWIFGAGDDAKPVAQFAQGLGFGSSPSQMGALISPRARALPSVNDLRVLPIFDLPGAAPQHVSLRPTDAAVVMTHSFDQDSRILAALLGIGSLPAYLGVLGPQRRTRELLTEATRLLGIPAAGDQVEAWLARMHAPTGLDLGENTPAAIALSIVAEIQQTLTASTGQPLRTVRAIRETAARR